MISNFFKTIPTKFQLITNVSKSFGFRPETNETLKALGEDNLYEGTLKRFNKAASFLKIPQEMINFYQASDVIMEFNLPLVRENGKFENIQAFRVQHKTYTIPTEGGLRFDGDFTIDDSQAIAMRNTFKSAALDIPFGGASGAIVIDPYHYTSREIEILVRKYTIELSKREFIGAGIDLTSPDAGTSEREMNWMKDTYQQFYGFQDINAEGSVTGKSMNQGGIAGSVESTGYGISYALKTMLEDPKFVETKKIEGGLKGKEFIIQGLGTVGYWVSHFLVKNGAKCIGIVEHDGCLYNKGGINTDDVSAYIKKEGKVEGFQGATFTKDDGVLYEKCDLLIPTFHENSINVGNADKIQAKMICEGSNGPITHKAGEILRKKKIFVFPDLLVNSGGHIAAYLEWIKNLSHTQHGLQNKRWDEKSKYQLLQVIHKLTGLRIHELSEPQKKLLEGASERDIVFSGIEEMIGGAITEAYDTSVKFGSSLRYACYINALVRLHEHYSNVGIVCSKA